MSVNLITNVAKSHSVNYILGSNRNVDYIKILSTCTYPRRYFNNLTSNTARDNKNSHVESKKIYLLHIYSKKFSWQQNPQCKKLLELENDSKKSLRSDLYRRWCSSESGPPSHKLPPLMNFPQIVWPSLLKSIRNFILSTFIIKPYFDREFNLPDFVQGAKKAVEVVSRKMSSGDIRSLEGLVTSDVLPDLQRTISLMSLPQREQLAIEVEDIYFSFPYQIGVIFNDEEGKNQKRFVEITMVFHTLRGLAQMRSRGEEPPMNMGLLPEYQKRISICNYRFVREFTTGVDSDWSVNLLNHFKPSEQMDD